MNMTQLKKMLSLLLCIVLIAGIALFTTGCSDDRRENPKQEQSTEVKTEAQTEEHAEKETKTEMITEAEQEVTVFGEGQTMFLFSVTDGEGREKQYEIHTDKTVVGEALMELGLLSGEEGPFGLYVKAVGGIEADFDKDGTYWAFYIDGEYAMTGVDVTEIEAGKAYSFKVEK